MRGFIGNLLVVLFVFIAVLAVTWILIDRVFPQIKLNVMLIGGLMVRNVVKMVTAALGV